jgi:hypothetical protein
MPGVSGVTDVARHRCKGGERYAAILGAKQKGHKPDSHAQVTDVALSSLPQNATRPGRATNTPHDMPVAEPYARTVGGWRRESGRPNATLSSCSLTMGRPLVMASDGRRKP